MSGIVGMGLVAIFVVVLVYGLHRAVSVLAQPLTVLPAQSGWFPQEHALSRFHVRWYLASIIFLAFVSFSGKWQSSYTVHWRSTLCSALSARGDWSRHCRRRNAMLLP